MKIAVCDDDKLCREMVVSIIHEYREQKNHDISVSVYEHAAALIDDVIRFGSYDIYILDIIMPWLNGIQLGIELRKQDPDGKILYITSSREYAIDSYRAKAFDYILKPVQKERMFSALDDAVNTIINRKEKSLIVKTRENAVKLTYDSILYVDLTDRKVFYHLINGTVIESNSIRTTFAEHIQILLSDSRFILCSPGLAVNLYYIIMADTDTLFFKNGQKLYIGKRAGRSIRSAWSDFWLNREGSK